MRVLWPFARANAAAVGILKPLQDAGLAFGSGDSRVPRELAMRVIEAQSRAVPALGVLAASVAEPSDFGAAELAARFAPDLGAALQSLARNVRLIDSGLRLEVDGQRTITRLSISATDGCPLPSAFAEFAALGLVTFARKNAPRFTRPLEVRFAHGRSVSSRECIAVLGVPVFYGEADATTLVMSTDELRGSMRHADAALHALYDCRAMQLSRELEHDSSEVGRVHADLLRALPHGEAQMVRLARLYGVSAATLRRHLSREQTSFQELRQAVRREKAVEYLRDTSMNVTEIGHALGYSSAWAFARAFASWFRTTPRLFREQARREAAGDNCR